MEILLAVAKQCLDYTTTSRRHSIFINNSQGVKVNIHLDNNTDVFGQGCKDLLAWVPWVTKQPVGSILFLKAQGFKAV